MIKCTMPRNLKAIMGVYFLFFFFFWGGVKQIKKPKPCITL